MYFFHIGCADPKHLNKNNFLNAKPANHHLSMKKLRVTVEGKIYDVLVEILDDGSKAAPAPAAKPIATAAAPLIAQPTRVATPTPVAAAPQAKGSGDVPTPLAGKIVSIDVKVGDAVTEGAQVATVEAMKMNTYIFASKTGNVVSIHASPGDGVEEGAVLLRIG